MTPPQTGAARYNVYGLRTAFAIRWGLTFIDTFGNVTVALLGAGIRRFLTRVRQPAVPCAGMAVCLLEAGHGAILRRRRHGLGVGLWMSFATVVGF